MNQLQFERSPYLLQHADNPVDWWAWSDKVIEQARVLHKPILVSIGYSTCHWCHVMAHESFEDPLTAEIMNDHFICVKIDREERPDLDHYFMNAVQAMGVSGGWPLHCFLTEDGLAFFGGTYYPPSPKFGRPSWNQILLAVSDAYRNKHRELVDQASQLVNHLAQLGSQREILEVEEEDWPIAEWIHQMMGSADLQHGGFGAAPKFPHFTSIQLLIHASAVYREESWTKHARHSLIQMGGGGIYDLIGGGLSRYSVDGLWNVPHFEKMLYDNAQWIISLCQAYGQGPSEMLKAFALDTLDYWECEMQHPSGYFYSAQDADSEGNEGEYYVWEVQEIKKAWQSSWEIFEQWMELSPLDHLHPEKKVIRVRAARIKDLDFPAWQPIWQELKSILKPIRQNRIPPSKDQKGIISWNAIMVSAYCALYRMTLDGIYKDRALQLLQCMLQQGRHADGALGRYLWNGQPVGYGFLEDYAYLSKACLDCYQLDFDPHCFKTGLEIYQEAEHLFRLEDAPFFWTAGKYHGSHPQYNTVDWSDQQYASPNAIICELQRYFYMATGEVHYYNASARMLRAMIAHCRRFPLASSSWIVESLASKEAYPCVKSASAQNIIEITRGAMPSFWACLQDQNMPAGEIMVCSDHQCWPPISNYAQWQQAWQKG